MILSVDLNPILRRRFYVKDLNIDQSNIKSSRKLVFPDGLGIELALLAQLLGIESKISGFVGGLNGENIKTLLDESDFNHEFVRIREDSTEIIDIVSNKRTISIGEIAPKVSKDDVNEFYRVYKENLNIYPNIALIGQVPSNLEDDVIYQLALMGKKWGRRVYLGYNSSFNQNTLEASPFMCILSIKDLEDITKLKLDYESEIIKATQYLLDKDIIFVVVDMGVRGVLVINKDRGYSLSIPPLENKDKKLNYGQMIAGFVLGFEKGYEIEIIVKLALASGLIHCYDFGDDIEMSDIKSLMNRIEVRGFNNI